MARSGDIAVEYGIFVISAADAPTVRGNYLRVYRKVGGEWNVAADAPVVSGGWSYTSEFLRNSTSLLSRRFCVCPRMGQQHLSRFAI